MSIACKYFRKILKTECVSIVGAYNGMVARQVADAGFNSCYLSGAALSASSGLPDIG